MRNDFGNLRIQRLVALVAAFVAATAFACSDDSDNGGNGGGGADTGGGGDTGGDGMMDVTGEITADTTWTADTTYVLKETIFVSGAVLTIEPGTTILGDQGSALIVTSDARIEATGTADAPIVFTSSQPAGERDRGDWGGLVLLGTAPINIPNGQVEGIPADDNRGAFGGSNAAHNCGTLRYVRVEFAGFEAFPDNELNGITVAGCGTDTTLEYVQSHMGLDDGIEFFGGTANMKWAVISRPGDDGLDSDLGWQGKVQYLVVMLEGAEGDNAFEWDNFEDDNDATPRSKPQIFNATLTGPGGDIGDQRGMNLRRGTAGQLFNFIVTGFAKEAIDIRDPATVTQINDGELALGSFIVFDIAAGGTGYFSEETGDDDDDGGFDESDYFMNTAVGFDFGTDPMLPAFDMTNPSFVPAAGSPAESGATSPDDDWFDDAGFIGAVEPGASSSWLDGWTSFAGN